MKNIEQNNQVHPISPKLSHFIFWSAILFICYVTIQNGFGATTVGEYAFFIGFFVACLLSPVWIVAEMLQSRVLYTSEQIVASRLFLKPISMEMFLKELSRSKTILMRLKVITNHMIPKSIICSLRRIKY